MVIAGVGGATVLGRVTLDDLGWPGALYVGFAWGALVGSVFGLALIYYFARIDTLRYEVARLHPDALVVVGMRDKAFIASLRRVLSMTPTMKQLFTVAFDREGLSFWTGTRVPERMALIPVKSILGVTSGESSSPGWGVPPYTRLDVRVQLADFVEELQFGVEAISPFGRTGAATEAQIAEFARTASELVGAQRAPKTTSSLSAQTLVPGTTAWAAVRVGRRVTAAVVVLGATVVALAMYLVLQDGESPILLVWPLAAMQGAYFLTLVASARAMKRERTAGYTTLNRVELDLMQLHPRTGAVLREAGALPLSADRFNELLR